MAATVREAIRELLQQNVSTIDILLEASDREINGFALAPSLSPIASDRLVCRQCLRE
jgi:hypothetical protein